MNQRHNSVALRYIAERFPVLLQPVAQGLKFGVIGIAATITHVTAFIVWIEMVGMAPLWANVAAFFTAVMVGFIGHFFWTFRDHGVAEMGRWKAALPRFIVVSLIGLGLNSVSIYMVVNVLSMSYWYAVVVMVTAVPICMFTLSKSWVFS